MAIQNCIDMAAHIVSEEGLGVAGSTNELFYLLEDSAIITTDMTEKMTKAVGFRNPVVHEYGKMDLQLVFQLSQSGLTKYLKTLQKPDLVAREVPVTEKNPEKSKKGLYRIKDNFISFWFKFVHPFRSYLEIENTEIVLNRIREQFRPNHVSFIYEDICRQWLLLHGLSKAPHLHEGHAENYGHKYTLAWRLTILTKNKATNGYKKPWSSPRCCSD